MLTYECSLDGRNGTTVLVQRWVPPGAADPEAAARAALARMGLTAIRIGMVPEEGAGRLGVVGMPVWMWVENPSAATIGPIRVTDSDGPVRVTLDATLTAIDWDMGDGTVVTCAGQDARGTEYVDSYDLTQSPTCGHVYRRQGSPYTITATSRWSVAWSGGGQAGTIPLELEATTARNIGELQVLSTR